MPVRCACLAVWVVAAWVVVTGCKSKPEVARKTDRPFVIRAEPVPAEPESNEHGCDYDPTSMITVTSDGWLVDGAHWIRPSDDAELELRNIFQAKRELEARLETPPKRDLLLQADEDIPAARLKRIKAVLHEMGYYNVELVVRRTSEERRSSQKRQSTR